MNGSGKLILLVMLLAFEGLGYSQAKRPLSQAKSIETQARSRKAAPKELESEAAPPSYFAGAFASFDLYGLVLGYQWNPAYELQLELRSVRVDSDDYKGMKWKRNEDSWGIHQRFYRKTDSWCGSLGLISRSASFKAQGSPLVAPAGGGILIDRQDLAIRLALGTQYESGSFIYGFDWFTFENRLLTLSSSHRATAPTVAGAAEGLNWDKGDSDDLFEFLFYTSIRIGWRF
jgi:hypothetical protein